MTRLLLHQAQIPDFNKAMFFYRLFFIFVCSEALRLLIPFFLFLWNAHSINKLSGFSLTTLPFLCPKEVLKANKRL